MADKKIKKVVLAYSGGPSIVVAPGDPVEAGAVLATMN